MQTRSIILIASVLTPFANLAAQTSQPDSVLYDRGLRDIEQSRYLAARLTLNTLVHTYDTSGYIVWAKLAIANSWLREGGQHGLTQSDAEYKDFSLFYPGADNLRENITVTAGKTRSTKMADLIQQTTPIYPADLLAQGTEGTVQLAATVSKDGVPSAIRLLNTPEHQEFVSAALDAVKQWRYKPALVNGQPIDVLTTIQVDFRLNVP